MAFGRRRRFTGRTGRRRPLRWTADSDSLGIENPLTAGANDEGAAALLLDSGSITPTGADPLESQGTTLTRIRGHLTPNFALEGQDSTVSVILRFNVGILVQDRSGGLDFQTQNPFDEDEDMSIFDWLWVTQRIWRLFMPQVGEDDSLSLDFVEFPTIEVDIKAQRKLHALNSCVWLVHKWTATGLSGLGQVDCQSRYLMRMLVRT